VREGFHGENSVAQLKPANLSLYLSAVLCFHGENSVAQLKPARAQLTRAGASVSTEKIPWPN
jgi:hypothetical protein